MSNNRQEFDEEFKKNVARFTCGSKKAIKVVLKNFRFISLLLALLLVFQMVLPAISIAEQPTVNLGTTESFAVLAGSTITNTGTTTINGNVGLHPGTAFPGEETATVNGSVHLADAVAEQAKIDLVSAYNDAAGRSPVNRIATELGGSILTPGVYDSADGTFGITGTLTLDAEGDANAVFVFKTASTLITAVNSNVRLINGARFCRIFWQVGSSATLGANSEFVGHIFALTSITADNGATVEGQLLARDGAVTLDSNTITNDICLPLVSLGSLTVDKIVSGNIGEMALPLYSITVTGPDGFTATRTFVHGESYTWENLVPGVYTVSESETGLSSEWKVSGEGTIQVKGEQTASSTITNTFLAEAVSLGSLTVDKIVSGNIGEMALPLYSITVTGPDGFTATRTFVHGESYTWENLVPGVYTVSESRTGLSSEWTVSGEGTVQVKGEQTASSTITNTFLAEAVSLGSLTVDKLVSGNIGEMALPLYSITVTGPDGFTATRTFVHGESYTWENLVPGVYTVSESRTGLSSEWTVSGEGTVQVKGEQTASSTITNTFLAEAVSLGSLTVDKIVSGNIGEMALPLYSITVTGPDGFTATRTFVHGESFTWKNLVPGEYTVSESRTGLSSEWKVSGERTVQVIAEQTASSTITNAFLAKAVSSGSGSGSGSLTVSLGSLTVNKLVSGDIGDMTLPLFSIKVTGPDGFTATRAFVHGESFTWKNLVPGAYTVSESRTGLSNEWTVSGERTVQVIAEQTASSTITNTFLVEAVSLDSPAVTSYYGQEIIKDIYDNVELPKTGGNTPWMVYSGLLLLGFGIRRKYK